MLDANTPQLAHTTTAQRKTAVSARAGRTVIAFLPAPEQVPKINLEISGWWQIGTVQLRLTNANADATGRARFLDSDVASLWDMSGM